MLRCKAGCYTLINGENLTENGKGHNHGDKVVDRRSRAYKYSSENVQYIN